MVAVDRQQLQRTVIELGNRWPSAGVAVGVVRHGSLDWFTGPGVADIQTKAPITRDTVFRIGSVTKTMTAVAVMQLVERGLIDLDAPASAYLTTFRLLPVHDSIPPPTVRQLLTHTAGIGYWRRLSDVLRPGLGSGVTTRGPVPSPGDYYRRGLPVEVLPGSKWMYSNHGFAALAQIVEDVTGEPIGDYLRANIFEPLAMDSTDMALTPPLAAALATGYRLRAAGLRPVVFRAVPLAGAGGVYSTAADLARYVAALLGGGSGEHGTVLKPESVETMFHAQFEVDQRLPGMGLSFFLGDEGGHRTVGHDGVVAGFLSAVAMAPDDGVGVIVLTNTGGLDARGVAQPLAVALLRNMLGVPNDPIRRDLPQRPEVWGELCGWYGLDPGPVANLFIRVAFGAGMEVTLRGDRLMLLPLTPVPSVRSGFVLYPDDPDDPYVFRADFAGFGLGSLRVVFRAGPDGHVPMRMFLNGMSFEKRPDARNPRRWATALLAVGAAALVLRHRVRRGKGS